MSIMPERLDRHDETALLLFALGLVMIGEHIGNTLGTNWSPLASARYRFVLNFEQFSAGFERPPATVKIPG